MLQQGQEGQEGDRSSAPGFFGFEPVTHQDTSTENRQLFYAKVSRAAGEDEIKQLFSQYGVVQDVIIFQSSQGSSTSKGCGLVTMASHAEASAAIQGLHGKYAWSNRDPPMVVTWMDAALQDPARQQHLAAAKLADMAGSGDTPPAGCEPDAIKLFVGNLPLHFTEEQMLPVFKAFGTVVELVIVRNKQSAQSKGCAFVWYANRAQAEAAMAALNLKHVLPDLTGQQTRPLVVRKARTGHMHTGGGTGKPSSLSSLAEHGIESCCVLPGNTLGARLMQHQQQLAGFGGLSGHSPAASSSSLTCLGGNSGIMASLGPASAQVLNSSNAALRPAHVPGRPVLSAPVLPASTPLHALSYQHSFTSQASASFPLQLATHYAVPGGTVVGDTMELQPITVHTLPVGAYVTTSTAGGSSGGTLRALQPASANGHYQLVMDVPPPAAAYNLQHIVGVSGDGMEQYVQVQPVHMHAATAAPAAATAGAFDSGQASSHGTLMALDAMQMAVVNDQLYVVQSSTGCQIMVSPGGPGTFNLLLTGSQPQVERAQLMLASLINQAAAVGSM